MTTVIRESEFRLKAELKAKRKKVPTLYEADEAQYAGPHKWQVHRWAKIVRKLWHEKAYARWTRDAFDSIEVRGLEHLANLDGPCVIVGNHQSHLDTLLVDAILPQEWRSNLFFGAAQDRWFVKGKKKLVLKPWYQSLALGNFPIMRGGGKKALAYASWLLTRGQKVFLFPEGTRATGSDLGQFKHGATLLALENEVPVVPVYLGGLKKIRPKGQRGVAKGHAYVEILPPLDFPSGTEVNAATQELWQRLNKVHLRCSANAEAETQNQAA
ncbi:MAG: lysophospholipid acyltransferase family protein [Pseudomonadota bacterium]